MKQPQNAPLVVALVAILVPIVLVNLQPASGQSVKGGAAPTKGASPTQATPTGETYATTGGALSPGAQVRQQRQRTSPAAAGQQPARQVAAPATKRRPQQEQQQQQQVEQQLQQQRDDEPSQSQTEDPLADSEPALYGSVAGAPGVDFPAYTRIPKTSFTCEGKGFDFGFYADEEAGCQLYHVCWSGRRESFLCGVGTVFNQAILACDYWHSVDCSKSSQFYSVNNELGKFAGRKC